METRRDVVRIRYGDDVDMDQAGELLVMAVLAAESVYGRSALRLDARFVLDEDRRRCVVDTGSPLGRDIALVYIGFLVREYGDEAIGVERP